MGETRNFTASEAAATTLEFRLAPATCRVYGQVFDKSGHLLRAEVYLSKSGVITQRIWTDRETGQYEFPLLPGTYDITLANAEDHVSEGWRGEVSADTKVDLSLGNRIRTENKVRVTGSRSLLRVELIGEFRLWFGLGGRSQVQMQCVHEFLCHFSADWAVSFGALATAL